MSSLIICSPQAPANVKYDTDDNVFLASNGYGCSICLNGGGAFNGCEMTLPDGCTLMDAALDNHQPDSHQMTVNSLGDGWYRLVVYAPADGKTCLREGAMVNLGLSGHVHGIKTAKPKRGVFIKDRKKKVVK